ncbi:MAG: PaaI family thioesterase [Vagococcus sp.]
MNLLDYLGIRTTHITPESVTLTMPVRNEHKQPFGLLHGGLNGVLIETACSMGANQHLPAHCTYSVGIDLNVNHLRSVSDGDVTVIATPIHIGKTTQVWEASVFHKDIQTSVGRCTLLNQ